MTDKQTGIDGREYYTVADHITVWIGEGNASVHLKTIEPYGDPVELNEDEVSERVALLNELADKIR